MAYTADQLMTDAEAALERHGATNEGFGIVANLMRRLAADPDLLTNARLAGLHGAGAVATILTRGKRGEALMLARFPPHAPTPIHNHNSWGIICVVAGRDRHIAWRRLDDGSEPGESRIERGQERELGPGDILWFPAPPHDIHSQQGIGGDAWELVFFGRDPDAQPRSYFDPDAGTVTQRPSGG